MIINLGLVGFSWKGEYSSSATYTKNDIVEYKGTSYIVLAVSIVGTEPVEGSDFAVFAEGTSRIAGNDGEMLYYTGSTVQTLPAGSVGQTLVVDQNNFPAWSNSSTRSGMKAKSIMDSKATYRRGFAVMTDGTMRPWGRGENWVLGQGSNTHDRSYPITVGFPPDAAPVKEGHFSHNDCAWAITEDGKLWMWGNNNHGDVGSNNTSDTYTPYCASEGAHNSIYGKTVIQVAKYHSGDSYLCTLALCSDGTVHSAGYNGHGQLGLGDTTQRSYFSQLPLLSDIVKIAGGSERYTSHYALKADGTMYSWGHGGEGRLGQGNTTQYNIATALPYFTSNGISIRDIGAGANMAWAIDTNDNLYTWGYNGYGNLGNGSTANRTSPVLVLTDVKDCEMSNYRNSYNYTMAIKNDGTVWAAGDNSYGCLGVSADVGDRSVFAQCMRDASTPLTNIVKVRIGGSGSYNYTIALDGEGIAYSVGYSANGQLGRGTWNTTNYYFKPVRLHRHRVADISVFGAGSEGATMFLTEAGHVYVTGYAGESQLPEDDDESASCPFQVIF